MKTIKYTSYAEIELELEILKTRKEISYHKMVLSAQQIKEGFTFSNVMGNVFESIKSVLSTSPGLVFSAVLPLIIRYIKHKKRGY